MNQSNKTQGFLLLLIFVWLGTLFLNEGFAGEFNSKNLIRYCSMFGIIGVGAMFVIVTGGIDLSIGSTIGLIGGSMVLLMRLNPVGSLRPLGEEHQFEVVAFFWAVAGLMTLTSGYWVCTTFFQKNFRARKLLFPSLFLLLSLLSLYAVWIANSDTANTSRIPWIFFLLISISLHIGLLHGVLVTRFQLQPFVVTLGGLLCYRGLVRWLAQDATQGLGSEFDDSLVLLAKGEICTVATLLAVTGIMLVTYSLGQIFLRKVSGTRRLNAYVSMSCGMVLGVIGSSRFWNGFERQNFVELFDIKLLGVLPVAFSTWETIIPEAASQRPQTLMQWSWVPLIGISLAMLWGLIQAIREKSSASDGDGWKTQLRWIPIDLIWQTKQRQQHAINHVIVACLGLGISSVLLWLACQIPAGRYELDVSSTALWWIEITAVFGALALLMISISRLGTCVSLHGNALARFCFPMAGLFAGLTVLGTTPIASTVVQTPFFIMVMLAIFAMIIFGQTVFGRYLLAIGNNEDAARYSGINTQELTVAAYVIGSGIIGISAIVFMLDSKSVAPTGFGSFYELYAIAAVVLGGCSLRGGEANVLGVLLGAAIMRVLHNAPDMVDFPKTLEHTILGLVIVVGVMVDERIRKQQAARSE